jgi:hypothetical protein
MKAPIHLLITSVVLAAVAAPNSAASQDAQSVTAGRTIESPTVKPRRVSAARWLGADEIQQVQATNAYEAVSRLRANWLRPRGASSLSLRSAVRVYLDGTRIGGVEDLRQMDTRIIGSIQYMDGAEATLRFGTGNSDGAILVSTHR